MRKFAKVVSVLLHPLLVPTLVCIVVLNYAPGLLPIASAKGKIEFTFFIFLVTFLVPLFSIFIYLSWGGKSSQEKTGDQIFFWDNLSMEAKEERIVPFTITTTLYAGMTYFLIYKAPFALHHLSIIFGGITMCLALVTFISRYWKISAHGAGLAGGLGFLIGIYLKEGEVDLFYPILLFIILLGLLMSARLHLGSHNLLQVSMGALTGFSICLGSMLFFG